MSHLTVIKIGGSTLGTADSTLADIAVLARRGQRLALVHGGGDEISRRLAAAGCEVRFVGGLRVTDDEALSHVVAALDAINVQLRSQLETLNLATLAFNSETPAMQAQPLPELGRVGAVTQVEVLALAMALDQALVPIVAPLAVDADDGGLLNVNADTAAGAIAVALKADRLLFMTDVEGLKDSGGRLLPLVHIDDAALLVADGTASGGMAPKLTACMNAAGVGIETAILDGRRRGSLGSYIEGVVHGTSIGAPRVSPVSPPR